MRKLPLLITLSVLLVNAQRASAVPLNLALGVPDIASSFISVSYNSTTDVLSASGFAVTLDDDGVGAALSIANGTFDLNASINSLGVLSGGTLAIGDTVAGLGFNSQPGC